MRLIGLVVAKYKRPDEVVIQYSIPFVTNSPVPLGRPRLLLLPSVLFLNEMRAAFVALATLPALALGTSNFGVI